MPFIIKGKEEKTGYYTGSGWDKEVGKAKRYPSKDAATAVITKHNMPATAEESDDTADQPADAPEKENGGTE